MYSLYVAHKQISVTAEILLLSRDCFSPFAVFIFLFHTLCCTINGKNFAMENSDHLSQGKSSVIKRYCLACEIMPSIGGISIKFATNFFSAVWFLPLMTVACFFKFQFSDSFKELDIYSVTENWPLATLWLTDEHSQSVLVYKNISLERPQLAMYCCSVNKACSHVVFENNSKTLRGWADRTVNQTQVVLFTSLV